MKKQDFKAIPDFASPSGQPVRGRSDGADGNGDTNQSDSGSFTDNSSRRGTVVIRATVEHIGIAGDTEMTVTVKWPASTFCVQPCAESPAQTWPGATSTNVPPNGPAAKNFEPGLLYGEFEPNAAPAQGSETSSGEEQIPADQTKQ